jgi:hypothetical protein
VNRGRLAKYALWQFRDFAMDKGIAILIIGALMGFVHLLPVRLSATPLPPDLITRLVTTLARGLILIWVFIALNGIISTDRKMGYYRFLFSKPVSPVRYYGQLYFIHLIGLLSALLVLSGAFFVFAGKFSVWNLVMYTALIYVAMGGIGFFLSAATTHDWVALAAVWLGSGILRAMYGNGTDWRSTAVELLPPVHRVDAVATTLISAGTASLDDVFWLAGYGALFFVLGLFLVHRRPLAA